MFSVCLPPVFLRIVFSQAPHRWYHMTPPWNLPNGQPPLFVYFLWEKFFIFLFFIFILFLFLFLFFSFHSFIHSLSSPLFMLIIRSKGINNSKITITTYYYVVNWYVKRMINLRLIWEDSGNYTNITIVV